MIEHISDPERCLGEISRVGRKGCIVAPSEAWEKVIGGVAQHFWFVRVNEGKLILEEKTSPILDATLERFAREMFTRNTFTPFYWQNRDLLEVIYEWREQAIPEIIRLNGL